MSFSGRDSLPIVSLLEYRALPPDPERGSPLDQWGAINAYRLGRYWTVAVPVPLDKLRGVRAVAVDKNRLRSVQRAGELPPIEIAVFADGSAWIVDGNHRLVAARKRNAVAISTVFTFVEPTGRI